MVPYNVTQAHLFTRTRCVSFLESSISVDEGDFNNIPFQWPSTEPTQLPLLSMDSSSTMPNANIGMKGACDRCHNLKSRCIKLRNSSACSRCQKQGSSCTYSPPLPVGRPRGKSYRSRESREIESMLRHSSYSTEGTPEEPQSLSSPDHSFSQENADFATVEMEPEKGIEDREIILPPSPQSQLHSLPTLCGMTLGNIESDTRDKDTSSSERHKMPSHRPIPLPAAEPDLHAGYLSTGQGLCALLNIDSKLPHVFWNDIY